MCNFLGSVSSHQKLEATDIKALGQTVLQLSALGQISVTTPFYLENKRKIHPRGMRACQPKRRGEERELARTRADERDPGALSPHFMFSHPPGLPRVSWASRGCCLFYPRSSLQSSDLPLLYFRGLFPSLSFSHCPSGLLFPILTT